MIVTPVGTCRITTPLRRADQRGEVNLSLDGIYGFVHTSREALQMIRSLNGDFVIPDSLADLIARPGYKPMDAGESDLFLVEISSLKDVRINDVSLQLNYMQRCFGDFFLDKERAKQFWRMAGPKDSVSVRHQWLETLPAFRQLSKADQGRLSSITRHMLTRKEIKEHIIEMQNLVKDSTIAIVTHVDARKPDGSTIASRSQLIEWLESICGELGVPFLNPTHLMEQHGQKFAMERGGKDLTHYTPAFSDVLFGELIEAGIVKSGNGVGTDELAVQIQEAMENIRQDRISEAGSVAYSMLESSPRPEVEELVAALEARIGNHKGALDRLTSLRKDGYRVSEDSRRILMSAYHALGNHEKALWEANGLISEEIESETVLRVAALSAEGLNKMEEAVSLWTVLYGQGVDEAASNLIRLAGESPTVRDIAQAELQKLPESAVPADVLWRHFVDMSDFENSRIAARHLRGITKSSVNELLSYADPFPRHQAELARIFAQFGQITDSELDGLRKKYIAAVSKKKGTDEIYQLENASAAVTLDKSKKSREKLREIRTKVRRSLASMQADGKHELVISWVKRITDGSVNIPKATYFAGRSANAIKDFSNASYWLERANEETPADISIQRALIQTYDSAGQQDMALSIAKDLFQNKTLSDEDRERIAKRITSMKTRAIKRVRSFVSTGQFREAISMLNIMNTINFDDGLVKTEQSRLLRAMARQLQESTLDDTADAEWLGTSVLGIDASHQRALKSMAILTMRERRYDESRKFWSRLADIRDKPDSALAQVAKCDKILATAAS